MEETDKQFLKNFRVIFLMNQVVMHYITATSIRKSRYIMNKCCKCALNMSGICSPACTIYLLGLEHLEPCLKEKINEQSNCIQSNCNQSCSVELNILSFFSHLNSDAKYLHPPCVLQSYDKNGFWILSQPTFGETQHLPLLNYLYSCSLLFQALHTLSYKEVIYITIIY